LLERRKFFAQEFTKSLQRDHRQKGYPPLAIFSQDVVGTRIFLQGFFELQELQSIKQHILPQLKHKSIFLDIGANIGNHTAALGPHFEEVIAFEPNPRTAKLLEANAMLFPNVSVRHFGLSNREECIQTSYQDHNVGAASVASGNKYENKVEFHLKVLDEQLTTEQMSAVSMIKLDVEGHEYEALQGMVRTLKESSPLVLFEINETEIVDGTTKAKEFLYENGYTNFYSLEDLSPFATSAKRLSKLVNSISVLLLGRKLRGNLIPQKVDGKLQYKGYKMMVASKHSLPFD